ncbi:MAG: hypothetical protein AAFV86_21545, partial [Pseudomonadota bacterium]
IRAKVDAGVDAKVDAGVDAGAEGEGAADLPPTDAMPTGEPMGEAMPREEHPDQHDMDFGEAAPATAAPSEARAARAAPDVPPAGQDHAAAADVATSGPSAALDAWIARLEGLLVRLEAR